MATQFGGDATGKTAGNEIASYDNTKCYRTRKEALAEIERECNVRFKCFDKWIADGRLGAVEARDRIERLISAWHFLSDSDEARKQLALEAQET